MTFTAGQKLRASQMSVYVCTSTTHPAGHSGQIAYETDTDQLVVFDGATWQPFASTAGIPVFLGTASVNTTVPTAVWTSIALNTEVVDTHGGHSTVTNNSRYTAQVSGVYICSGVMYWQGGTGGSVRAAILAVNGVNLGYTQFNVGGLDGVSVQACPVPLLLTAGDYVELRGYQNSGANRNTLAAQTSMAAQFVRPLP
jgi:hypothetical protein